MSKLEVTTQRGRDHLKTIEAGNLPRVGEKLEIEDRRTFEVVEIVHTPLIRDWDAVVIVRAVAMLCILPIIAA
jgi:hypothetical protein